MLYMLVCQGRSRDLATSGHNRRRLTFILARIARVTSDVTFGVTAATRANLTIPPKWRGSKRDLAGPIHLCWFRRRASYLIVRMLLEKQGRTLTLL